MNSTKKFEKSFEVQILTLMKLNMRLEPLLTMLVSSEMSQLGDVVNSNKIKIKIPELFKAFFHVQKLKNHGLYELVKMLKPRYKKIAGATEMLDIALLCIDLGSKEIEDKKDLMKCIK
jgi:hypothetical protein